MTSRWDETWHRLHTWRGSAADAQALAQLLAAHSGYHAQHDDPAELPPVLLKDGQRCHLLAWFAPETQSFLTIKRQLSNTLAALPATATPTRIVLMLNQALTPQQRKQLAALCPQLDLFHLERITALLDQPALAAVRQQFLHGTDDAPPGHANGVLLTANWAALLPGQIQAGQLHLEGDSYPLALACPPFETPEQGIGALLTWRARIPAQLHGCAHELASLHTWAAEDAGEPDTLVRILHGSAGSGKTRLAMEFAEQLAAEGWQVGQLSEPLTPTAMRLPRMGTLLLIDYPEQYFAALENLLQALRQYGFPGRLRILLLCRNPDCISGFITGHAPQFHSPALLLPPLQAADTAWRLFAEGWQRMRHILDLPDAAAPLDQIALQTWLQRDPQHATPLMILAFALNLIHQPEATRLGKREILISLVARERWRMAEEISALAARDSPNDAVTNPLALDLLKAIAAIPGHLSVADLAYLKANLETGQLRLPGPILLQDTSLWQVGARPGLAELQPDLLAATLLASVLHECLPDSMHIAKWLWHGLVTGMLLEQEAAVALSEPAANHLRSRLSRLARLSLDSIGVVEGGGTHPMLDAMLAHLDPAQANVLLVALDGNRNVLEWPLQALAVAAGRMRVQTLDSKAADGPHPPDVVEARLVQAELAKALNNWSVDLAASGARSEALAAVQRAAAIYEQLTQRQPNYRRVLADSLSNLAVRLAESGDQLASLTAITRAVAIFTDLAQQDSALHGADLAMGLANMAGALASTGDHAGAVQATRRAVDIYQGLAQQDFAIHGPNWALSLHNLALSLAASGDLPAALAASEQAIRLRETLAEQNFAAHGPALARGLNNHSVLLADSGERLRGLQAVGRAVAIYESLAQENFAAFGPDLAMSLNNLAIDLGSAGDAVASLATIGRAAQMYEALAAQNPAAYRPLWARCLNNLAAGLAASGDVDGGLRAIRCAVEIYTDLTQQNFAGYGADLAMSLNNLSNHLSEMGEQEAGLSAIARAVGIYEDLAQHDFAAHAPVLAKSLSNMGLRLAERGELVAALLASRRAVALREQLAQQNPNAYTADLAHSLNLLSNRLAQSGERAEALAVIERAVVLRESLMQQDEAAHAPGLATSLHNLSNRLVELEQHQAGLAAVARAVQLRERLAAQNLAAHGPDLASSLHNLSQRLAATGEPDEGIRALRRVVAVREALAGLDQVKYGPHLAMAFNNLAARLLGLAGDDVGRQQAPQREQYKAQQEALMLLEKAIAIISPFAQTVMAYQSWLADMQRSVAMLKAVA